MWRLLAILSRPSEFSRSRSRSRSGFGSMNFRFFCFHMYFHLFYPRTKVVYLLIHVSMMLLLLFHELAMHFLHMLLKNLPSTIGRSWRSTPNWRLFDIMVVLGHQKEWWYGYLLMIFLIFLLKHLHLRIIFLFHFLYTIKATLNHLLPVPFRKMIFFSS